MKLGFASILVFLMVFILPANLSAAEIEPEGTASRKLQRGFLNVALSPIAFTQAIQDERRRKTPEPSWLFGALRGSVVAVGRGLIGVMEIVTAPFEVVPNREPLVEPEFSWSYLDPPKKPA